jgi:hypothetical protein
MNVIVDKYSDGVYPLGNQVSERRDFDIARPRVLILPIEDLRLSCAIIHRSEQARRLVAGAKTSCYRGVAYSVSVSY